VRRGVVARHELFERLQGAARVTQVSARAGSGKTLLLRSWIDEARLGSRTAWVSVARDEHDPQRFWISIVDALRATVAGSELVRNVTAAPTLEPGAIIERLLEDLHALEARLWLVIDDLHELRSDETLRQLELFLLRSPVRLRFVLSTRRDRRLGLHRLRLEDELTEIRDVDLRFTLEAAQELLSGAGITLSESALEKLYEQTEGWVAGLRLAALALAGDSDPERLAREFSGSDRTVAEYLLAEVLDQQPEDVKQLLLRTSLLESVNGPLAEALTGDAGAEKTLQELEEANAFVISLDSRRSWFRYHRLFADLLQLELRREAPGELSQLHSIAADWYAEHGNAVEAIRHAQATPNWSSAAHLIADNWIALQLDGHSATAHELLAGFPAELVKGDSELVALLASDELNRGALEEAQYHLALASQEATTMPAERRGPFELMLAVLRLSGAGQRGDLPTVFEEAAQLLSPTAVPEGTAPGLGDDLRALALVNLGAAEMWAVRIEAAQQHLKQGVALARRIKRPYLEVRGLAYLVHVESVASSPEAVRHSMEVIELAREHGWNDDPIAGNAYAVLGTALIAQGRIDEAEPALEHAERMLDPHAQPAAAMVLRYGRGALELARGRNPEALVAFDAAEQLAERLVTPPPAAWRAAFLIPALLRLGDMQRVELVLDSIDEPERNTAEARTALAALQVAQGDPEGATSTLRPVLEGSINAMTQPSWTGVAFILEAIARDALDDAPAVEAALEHALEIAEPDGVLFPFLLYPAPDLLERHPRHRTAHAGLLAQVRALLGGAALTPKHRDPAPLLEPLSEAETRVLRYLPTNLSAPEIANELYLSVNTVKTHISHVYAKLGTHRRAEAVERARTLGLLAPSPRPH
jgi:LuxR family maltose regulon positive regulatory protein